MIASILYILLCHTHINLFIPTVQFTLTFWLITLCTEILLRIAIATPQINLVKWDEPKVAQVNPCSLQPYL